MLAGMNQVGEGVEAVGVVMEMAAERGLEIHIAAEVAGLVKKGRTAADAYRGRPRAAPGHEVHGTAW